MTNGIIYNSQARRQPKCPMGEWIKKLLCVFSLSLFLLLSPCSPPPHTSAHTHGGVLYSHKRKEQSLAICDKLEELQGYYAK